VEFDCRFAALGKPIELEKLDVTVTMTSDVDVTPSPSVNVKNDGDKRTSDVRHAQPIVFVHRTPADTGQQDITVNSLEDIVRFAYLLPQPAYHPLNAMVTNKLTSLSSTSTSPGIVRCLKNVKRSYDSSCRRPGAVRVPYGRRRIVRCLLK